MLARNLEGIIYSFYTFVFLVYEYACSCVGRYVVKHSFPYYNFVLFTITASSNTQRLPILLKYILHDMTVKLHSVGYLFVVILCMLRVFAASNCVVVKNIFYFT